jgi:hypothetical protein
MLMKKEIAYGCLVRRNEIRLLMEWARCGARVECNLELIRVTGFGRWNMRIANAEFQMSNGRFGRLWSLVVGSSRLWSVEKFYWHVVCSRFPINRRSCVQDPYLSNLGAEVGETTVSYRELTGVNGSYQQFHFLFYGIAFMTQGFHELRKREGVDDISLREPAFAGDAGAEAEESSVFVAMGIAVDDAFDAFGFGVLPEAPVHVETIRVGVEFDPGASFGAGVDNGLLIDLVGFALEKESSCQMAEHVDVGVLRGANDAVGVVGFVAGKAGMEAGDDDIEFGKEVVVEIETVLEDIDFGAGEQAEFTALVGERLVDLFNGLYLFAESGGFEAMGLKGGFGMISDGPVIAADFDHVIDDVFKRRVAVAPGGVIVKRAAEFGPFKQAWELPLLCCEKFAVVFAQFGRDVSEVELLKNFLFSFARDEKFGIAGFLLRLEEAVFVEAQTALNGTLAHDDVVFLAAGEIGESEGKFGITHDAEVSLNAAGDDDCGLGVTFCDDVDDAGLGDEEIEDRGRLLRRDEEIDVADDLLGTAQAAGAAAADDIGMAAESVEDRFGGSERGAEMMFRGVGAAERDAFTNFDLRLLTESGEFRNLAGLAGGFEFCDSFDAEFVVQDLDLLGTDAGDLEHFQKAGRSFGPEFVVVGHVTGGDELGDFLLERFAETFDVAETIFGDEFFERFVEGFKRAGGVCVRTGFEGIFALQFEQNPNFNENLSHLLFVHRENMEFELKSSKSKVTAVGAFTFLKCCKGRFHLN